MVTDPVLSGSIGPLVRRTRPPRDEDTAGLSAVLLSHLHYDHTDLPSLEHLGSSTPVLAPRGAGSWLEAQGVRDVRELGAGDEESVGLLRIVATAALHDGRRRPFGVRADAIGFVVCGSSSVYFAGDTDLFPGMADLTGSVDLALLPVSGWGPTVPAGHLTPERAAVAAALISPAVAVPVHWGTFALWPPALWARDPERPAREFAALVARHAPGVTVAVPTPGDRIAVPTQPPAPAPTGGAGYAPLRRG